MFVFACNDVGKLQLSFSLKFYLSFLYFVCIFYLSNYHFHSEIKVFISTRSSAIAEKPARRSVSVEMLFYCCTNDANRSRVSLRITFSNCHVLFGCLYNFVHALLQQTQLSHSQHAVSCASSLNFRTTNLVDVNWTVTVINQRRVPPMLLTTPRTYSSSAPSWRKNTNFQR